MVVVNHVKADKRQQFEKFVHETLEGGLSRSAGDQQAVRQTRILHPVQADADGTYPYVLIMDPKLPGYDYDIAAGLKRAYGEAEGADRLKEWDGVLAREQDVFMLVQADD